MTTRSPFPISDLGLSARLRRDGYPRAASYDPWWVVENSMGPNPIWLAESLLPVLQELPAGARILDLGCGRAITLMFLAVELGAQVWAADLWIGATENLAGSAPASCKSASSPCTWRRMLSPSRTASSTRW